MAKTLTMTIPDAVHAALKNEGKELEQEPGEVLKQFLLTSYKQEGGAVLNLRPVTLPVDANQTELPLK